MDEKSQELLPDELIMRKIHLIRGLRVMLDMDLAELYGVETKQLKRAVRRNIRRFPEDFMFELSTEEFENLRYHFGTSRWGGVRYPPLAFTEQGIAMLSSVLNSDGAIMVNIRIIRIFTMMREMLSAHKDLVAKLIEIEHTISDHDNQFLLVFEYLRQLEQARQQQDDQATRKRIGFKRGEEPEEQEE